MKKFAAITAFTALSFGMFAQNTWRWGLTIGSVDNPSRYSGGMSNAAAIFNHNRFEGGYLGVIARKTYCPHFSAEIGLEAVTYGFRYEIAQDYSLNQKGGSGTINQVKFGILNIPITGIFNSNYNCSNWRWYAGLGLSFAMGGQPKDITSSSNPSDAVTGNTTISSYINQDVHFAPVISPQGHIVVGIEKLLRSGRMLSAGFTFNKGFTPLATSTVNYTANNQGYQHSFTNYGTYTGVTIKYYFKSHGGAKTLQATAGK